MDTRREKRKEHAFQMGQEEGTQYVFQLSPTKSAIPMLRTHKVPEMTLSNAWQILRLCVAEMIGTAILNFAVVRAVEHPPEHSAAFLIVPIALTLSIWIAGPISGGHINPAVTLALCSSRLVSFIYLPIYWLSQFFGALTGAALAHGFTVGMLNDTAVIRAVAMANQTTAGSQGYVGQFFGLHLAAELTTTTMLLLTVLVSADSKRPSDWGSHGFYTSLAVGMMALIIGLFFGSELACFVNPVVALGLSIVLGLKSGFWAHIIGPLLASLVAALLFQFMFCADAGLKRTKACLCVSNYDYSTDLSPRDPIALPDK
uniref:Aquaporin-5 n=1 Tax=Schistocephalus solidus TaxID=70667 RepID=A0A0X3PCK8_SCHSO